MAGPGLRIKKRNRLKKKKKRGTGGSRRDGEGVKGVSWHRKGPSGGHQSYISNVFSLP